MIDMQLINNALLAIGIWSGAAVVVAISIIAIAATRHRPVRHRQAVPARRHRTWTLANVPAPR